ncbi:hypothetical protein LEP1GSC121_3606 [Leptospira borgpetersenii serovar Castellonis str. 200801910]|uniref:Uncharacterized protein n=1 Tax=Leptospira borgpetersenii serovar Ballum TaxID=280505 RepID=A0A0S2IW81_LEPBO|nr:hypothetical protein LBBP_03728 [Leptospira borgpetersenii serovar Ballum]EKR00014.1 hypothetical protein LEP1GSC121_3606 [Leptospira borgpetersenii serovar Castellonis str. 200801910]
MHLAKKDLLKQAAGAHVRKTLGGESSNEPSSTSSSTKPKDSSVAKYQTENSQPVQEIIPSKEFVVPESERSRTESNQSRSYNQKPDSSEMKATDSKEDSPIQNSSSSEALKEKHLPKKNHLHRISSVMRLEDYTKPEPTDREDSSRFLKITGIILLALAIWFFWPAKHEIYMDIDKMTPEKVSGMSSQKEYHFSHGQDFFIYYKKGWSTPKRVRLTVYRTDGGKEEFSVQEKDFRKSFEKFQTYYDDTFFDQPGSYEVEIRDEDGELLVNKKFTID